MYNCTLSSKSYAFVLTIFAIFFTFLALPLDAKTIKADNYVETKDRVTAEELRRLVKVPVEKILAGQIREGRGDFNEILSREAQIQKENRYSVIDALTAMGVTLYTDGKAIDNEVAMRISVEYFRKCVEEARKILNADDPELALDLNDYADVERKIDFSNPPADVEPTLVEAYEIRRKTLGPNNPETAATLSYIGEVKGLPSRTQGDAHKVRLAITKLDDAIRLDASNGNLRPEDPAWMREAKAYVYLRNNLPDEAEKSFDESELTLRSLLSTNGSLEVRIIFRAMKFAEVLEDKHFQDAADRIRLKYSANDDALVAARVRWPDADDGG